MLAFIWLLLSGVALAQISFNVTTTGTAITMAPGSVLTAANGTTVLNGTYTIMYSSGADTGTFYVGVNVSNQPVCYYSSGITLSNWAVSGFAGGTCTSGSPPTNIYTVAISIVAGAVGSAPTQYQPITNQSITEGAGIIVMNNTQVVCADATGSSIGCIEPDGVTCSVSAGVLTCNEGGVIYGGGNLTITGGVPYQNGTAATVTSDAGFKISSDILTLGTNSGSSGGVVLNGNTSTNSASLGTELTTSGGCSGTGWGGTYPNYTAPGTTQALTCNLTGGTVTNDSYQTLITITGYSAGTLTCAVGGATFAVFAANNTTAYGPKATGTGALVCTPTSTFASGTGVSVSVKQISPITTYTYFTTDSGGNLGVGAILQQTASLNNYFFGGGTYNTTGSDNTSLGRGSMFANTTGADNTSVGTGAMSSNTTGVQNVAVGAGALGDNVSGSNNTACGNVALQNNTTGDSNTACGAFALRDSTTGTGNTADGYFALRSNTTGSDNVAVGYQAGYTATSGNANVSGSDNTYLGYQCGANTSTQLSNTICIGYQALNAASNTAVVGNPSLTDVYDGSTSAVAVHHFARALLSVGYSAAGTALPSCNSGLEGTEAYVTDATSPTYLGTYTSGGSVVAPVFCNGAAWVTH